MEFTDNQTKNTTLEIFENQWKDEGKTRRQIARLRYYHKNKKRILEERRSVEYLKYKRR